MSALQNLVKTVILIEDRRFYRHLGIDLIATARATMVNLQEGRYAQGGSTITQQLARAMYLTPKKTLARKLVEAAIAFWLEVTTSKTNILRMYFSRVYMGQNADGKPIRGFWNAARYFFKKPLWDLTVAEQATLVAMLRGPNLYKPGSALGLARRTLVLGVMLNAGLIDREEFFAATKEKVA